MSEQLTEKQREILSYIEAHKRENGYPPTVNEVMLHFGFSSPTAVTSHVNALIKKGYLRKASNKARALEIVGENARADIIRVPLLGEARAGVPMIAPEAIEETFEVPKFIAQEEDVFMVKVKGDSMIGAGILDGDYALAKPVSDAQNADIVVAQVYNDETSTDEIAIKRFYREQNGVRLSSENPEYAPIRVKEATLIGKVIGVIRLTVR